MLIGGVARSPIPSVGTYGDAGLEKLCLQHPTMADRAADPAKQAEEAAAAAGKAEVAAGKQPAVPSGHDDDAEDDAAADPAAASKTSKHKKLEAALTGKSGGPQASMQKAMANLTPAQVAELMALNPALAQELGINPEAAGAAHASGAGGASSEEVSKAAEALKRLNLQDIITGLTASGRNVKDMGAYKFWQTQLVPRFDEVKADQPVADGPLKQQTLDEVPKEPYPLVPGFEWDTLDLEDDAQLAEVYELLNGHYVEDDESLFRFNYSKSILKW